MLMANVFRRRGVNCVFADIGRVITDSLEIYCDKHQVEITA